MQKSIADSLVEECFDGCCDISKFFTG